jgi:hypothetical protein
MAWEPGSSRDSLKASSDGSTFAMFGLASYPPAATMNERV